MKCDVFRKRISAFIDGELTETEETVFNAHRESCSECSSLLDKRNAENEQLRSVFSKPCSTEMEEMTDYIMEKVTAMGPPPVFSGSTSMFPKVFYSIYIGLITGIFVSIVYFLLFSSFFSIDNILGSPEARSALFGALSILTGCLFIMAKGRDVTVWINARIRRGLKYCELAFDTVLMLLAGACFWACGGVLLISGIF